MTPRQLAGFKAALEKARTDARADGPAKIEPNRKDPIAVGVPDEDEQALSEMMQTLASTRNKKQAELLAQITRALRKLDTAPDDFGLCEDCEEAIPAKRLQALPYATLCTECQSKQDPRRNQSRKGLTDYDR